MPEDSLRSCILFHDLTDESFSLLEEHLDEIPCKLGEVVFEEGDVGDALYVIKSGAIKVTKTLPDGKKLVVAQLGEGEIFGEMSLVSSAPRSSSCVFIQNGYLWRLSRENFEALGVEALAVHTRIMRNIAALLCERLATMTDEASALLAQIESEEEDLQGLEERLKKGKTGLLEFFTSLGGKRS